MAKKQGIDDIISGIGDIMPPSLNGKNKLTAKSESKGVKRLAAREGEKIDNNALGVVIAKRSYEKGLIKNVEIKSWATQFDFYEDFLQKAVLYLDHFEPKAEYVPFFSFTPQYGHFNQRQLDYYSLWRYNVRRGKYLTKIDFSYVLLFIYEIINLTPKYISPQKGCSLLSGIWKHYRNMFYPIDKYLSEWMCDYCLIHDLPCPHGEIDSFLPEILKKTSLPEFYLNDMSGNSGGGMLLETQSEYDFRKGKYVNGENREFFERHINQALGSCFDKESMRPIVSVVRDSYVGALCLCDQKRRMNIEYISFNNGVSDEQGATNAVKYAENMVRSELGIKGRHQGVVLDEQVKKRLDNYFAHNLFTGERAERLKMELADVRYQPLDQGFSTKEAEDIEEKSREVIQLLAVEDELEDSVAWVETDGVSVEENSNEQENVQNGEISLDPVSKEGLLLIYEGRRQDFEEYCTKMATLPEAVADEINYFAFLNIDDIILEERDGWYAVSDEYTEVVEKWLKTGNK